MVLQKLNQKLRTGAGEGPGPFAIVASKYNARFVNGMLAAAEGQLRRAGATRIIIARVPGAFEIPLIASILAKEHRPLLRAIICLGVILKGETSHAELIARELTASLARLQLETAIPVIHEVLLLETEAQAVRRCLGRKYNRGLEAAHTALEMSELIRKLRSGNL